MKEKITKDFLIKVLIILGILFSFIFVIVRAASEITIKCNDSNLEGQFISREKLDTINGEFFDNNDLAVIHYDIVNGLGQKTEKNFVVELDGLEDYDKEMIKSCISLFNNENTNSFDLVINYRNYLNYNQIFSMDSTTNGNGKLPELFQIKVYGTNGEDKILVLNKDFEIHTESSDGISEIDINPWNSSYIRSPYTNIQTISESDLINEYFIDFVVGAWEYEKTYIFDFDIYDNSKPRKNTTPITGNGYFIQDNNNNPIDGMNIKYTTDINGINITEDGEGPKLVFEYKRPESEEKEEEKLAQYSYIIKDINGNQKTIVFNINFKKFQRISIAATNFDAALRNSDIVEEKQKKIKAGDGSLDLVLYTQNYSPTMVEVRDEQFKEINDNDWDAESSNNLTTYKFKNLETGWYNIYMYHPISSNPTSIYSFFYEKGDYQNKTYVYNGSEKIEIFPGNVTNREIGIDYPGKWVFLNNEYTLNSKKIKNPTDYMLAQNYTHYFSNNFNGALYLNAEGAKTIRTLVSPMSGVSEEYVLYFKLLTDEKYSVLLSPDNTEVVIPTGDKLSELQIAKEIRRNNTPITDIDYDYEITYNGEKVSEDIMYINKGTAKDILKVSNKCLKGDYEIKMYLVSMPEIFTKVTISTVFVKGENDVYTLTINNDSNIVVPETEGYKNVVELKGLIIENGELLDEEGTFEITKEANGVSLQGNKLTVLHSAKIGDKFTVKLSYKDLSEFKTFVLCSEADGDTSGIVNEDDEKGKIVSAIKFYGFEVEDSLTKYLIFDDTSGDAKTIHYKCYDENGKEIKNPDLLIVGTDETNGVYADVNYDNKTVTMYANGLYQQRECELKVYSGGSLLFKQPIVLCEPDTWACTLDFEKYNLTKNTMFSSVGTFKNLSEEAKDVCLVLIMYDSDNKMLRTDFDHQTLKMGEEKEFKAKFILPGDKDNIMIKTFFVNGKDLTDCSKLYSPAKTITNREAR